MNIKCFELAEISSSKQITEANLYKNKEKIAKLKPFIYQPINVTYDIRGIEHIEKCGEILYKIRFSVQEEGNYRLIVKYNDNTEEKTDIIAEGKFNHGFIGVSKTDRRYFSYTDSEPFYLMGINMVYPTAYGASDGKEFGKTGTKNYIGLKQYERWIKRCSENGVNMVRIWLGHEYFCPDNENVEEVKYEQYSKLDMLVNIAKKYGVYLKFTIEQFRFFVYENKDDYIFNLFNKKLSLNGERCMSTEEWLREEKWQNAWLNKLGELAARYAYDTSVFAVELWNEMSTVGYKGNELNEWNEYMLPKVKELFPNTMVVNSLGSLDTDEELKKYKDFPWHKCDFKQLHRYLDQGYLDHENKYQDTGRRPIEVIQKGMELIKDETLPFVVAETGAVNNNHSGPFKFYSCDDRGIIFVDCVYTPVFLGSASCGNIWHWDERYVESKNLYKYYKPLADMIEDIDFSKENFKSVDLSDDDVYLFVLDGDNVSICFIRNKADNWENTLKDDIEPKIIDSKEIEIKGVKRLKNFPIWADDTTSVKKDGEKICINNIRYGTIFKMYK